jgi:hypothetical protein
MKQSPGKYADLIEEWLHEVAMLDAEDSFGDVQAPTGYVWKVTLDPEVRGLDDAYLQRKICEWFSPFFLVLDDSNGHVRFPHYATAEERDQVYQELSELYYAWADDEGGPA